MSRNRNTVRVGSRERIIDHSLKIRHDNSSNSWISEFNSSNVYIYKYTTLYCTVYTKTRQSIEDLDPWAKWSRSKPIEVCSTKIIFFSASHRLNGWKENGIGWTLERSGYSTWDWRLPLRAQLGGSRAQRPVSQARSGDSRHHRPSSCPWWSRGFVHWWSF